MNYISMAMLLIATMINIAMATKYSREYLDSDTRDSLYLAILCALLSIITTIMLAATYVVEGIK